MIVQRRGAKEALEAASEGALTESGGAGGGDDDIVVDAMLETQGGGQGQSGDLREFVLNADQLLGLDQAILQSIDRCGMYVKFLNA